MFTRKSKFTNFIFSSVFIFLFVSGSAFGGIDKLKGTYSILKDPYKHLSVIHGAVASNLDWEMRLYDVGAARAKRITMGGQEYNVPDLSQAVLEKLEQLDSAELRKINKIREVIDVIKQKNISELINLAEKLEQKLQQAELQVPSSLKTETPQGGAALPARQLVEPVS